jgi:hypothetical protein
MRLLRGRHFGGSALVATASAFLAVGFSRPRAQTHDEFKSEFVVATNALIPRPMRARVRPFPSCLSPCRGPNRKLE